jgi:hypothetical protein
MSAAKVQFTIFTAERTCFVAEGRTLLDALKRSSRTETAGFSIVAVVESSSVVTPAPGKLTALIVRSSPRAIPV